MILFLFIAIPLSVLINLIFISDSYITQFYRRYKKN